MPKWNEKTFWQAIYWRILGHLDQSMIREYSEERLEMIQTKDAYEFVQDHAPDPGDRL